MPTNTIPIKWLKDVSNNLFFPVTHLSAVRDEDNANLVTILGTKLSVMSIVSQSSGTVTAAKNTYYKITSNVGTATITLPTMTSTEIGSIVFNLTTSSSPAITFTSASSLTINYFDGFSLEASTEYEINALWNGTKWVLARNKIVSSIS